MDPIAEKIIELTLIPLFNQHCKYRKESKTAAILNDSLTRLFQSAQNKTFYDEIDKCLSNGVHAKQLTKYYKNIPPKDPKTPAEWAQLIIANIDCKPNDKSQVLDFLTHYVEIINFSINKTSNPESQYILNMVAETTAFQNKFISTTFSDGVAQIINAINQLTEKLPPPSAPKNTSHIGWSEVNENWVYYNSNGSIATNEWKKSGNSLFFMGENGFLTKDKLIAYDGDIYYVDSFGFQLRNSKKVIDGKNYQFGADGKGSEIY